MITLAMVAALAAATTSSGDRFDLSCKHTESGMTMRFAVDLRTKTWCDVEAGCEPTTIDSVSPAEIVLSKAMPMIVNRTSGELRGGRSFAMQCEKAPYTPIPKAKF